MGQGDLQVVTRVALVHRENFRTAETGSIETRGVVDKTRRGTPDGRVIVRTDTFALLERRQRLHAQFRSGHA